MDINTESAILDVLYGKLYPILIFCVHGLPGSRERAKYHIDTSCALCDLFLGDKIPSSQNCKNCPIAKADPKSVCYKTNSPYKKISNNLYDYYDSDLYYTYIMALIMWLEYLIENE